MPRLSVVMSVYNSEAHIAECIESVLAQSFRDFEFLIIDDGSTDTSPDLLRQFAARDSRIQIITQENNGLTKALIRGCELARGEYIARQDDDDRSHPERFARQLAFLDAHPEVGFVGCATRYIGPKGESLELVTRDADPVAASRKLRNERQGPPAHGGVMFRRDAYLQAGGYRSQFYCGQDSDLWLRMVEHSQFACIPEESYYFRRHAASVSSRHRDLQRALGAVSHDCRKARADGRSEAPFLNQAQTISDQIQANRATQRCPTHDVLLDYLVGSRLTKAGDASAPSYLWSVITRRPWHWRAWVRLFQSYANALFHRRAEHD
ncbi:MAG: glycosyltransferase family 2 protein [Planctomycetaceae bacterium]|nr:glycosyltransferase family 2 protein [Planctomycetaceae bacterium]